MKSIGINVLRTSDSAVFLLSVQYSLIENCVLQMLVYEFMPNGTLRDHLSGKWEVTCSNICFCFPY